jgi:hypothetical protein
MEIENNLLAIRRKVANLSANVQLVAVSKFQSSDKILQAIAAGQMVFGENRVQEATEKWPAIKKIFPDIKLHLIGTLQTNKAREAVAVFDVIEIVDRTKLADCLAKEMQKQGKNLPCLIQVNIGREPQKSGIMPEEVDEFIKYCIGKNLAITGLMCIPPESESPEPYFMQMQNIAKRNDLKILSMGMSGDFESAIKCGATHVRVGTAIFGKRV